MKKLILSSLSFAFILSIVLSSCAVSNDVVSNRKVQKRKYQKGFFHANNNKSDIKKAEDVAAEMNEGETITLKSDLVLATTSVPMAEVIIPADVRAEKKAQKAATKEVIAQIKEIKKAQKIQANSFQTQSNETATADIEQTLDNSAKDASSESKGGESQLIALILAIFLGGLGVHRFYLGYIGIGVIQLLTAGGCGIWALIDIILILMDKLGPKDGSYEKTL
jgi:thiol:disulfide interchange protein